MERRHQPWFLNCAVQLKTDLSPRELLAGTQKIEADLGRNRVVDKGPRTIDIDIVLFDRRVVAEPDLKIPHPAMAQRRFVLEPLSEIAPNVVHPLTRKTIAVMRSELPEEGQIRRLS